MPNLIHLAPGVDGMFIENARFKTTRISVSFHLPLNASTLSENAMLPYLLASSCREHPDFTSLQSKLNQLYGASLSAYADKLGDCQVLRISVAALDDQYTLSGEPVLADCAVLLASLIFDPALENSDFKPVDVAREKRLFLEKVEGEINEKRQYAKSRLEAGMCKAEPFGLPRLGTKEGAASLSAKEMFGAWERMLKESYVRINVVGSTPPDKIFDSFSKAFTSLNRGEIPVPQNSFKEKADEVKKITERMDINQGKLVIGFRAGVAGSIADTVTSFVMTDLLGGGPYSRLFTNVRERLGLCYYCAARFNRHKGIMTVESGVEMENVEQAVTEILRQVDIMKSGAFTDEELVASKMSLNDSAKSVLDSSGDTDFWYGNQVFGSDAMSPEEMAAAIEAITKDDIVKAAERLSLDTVYLLAPKEDAGKGGADHE